MYNLTIFSILAIASTVIATTLDDFFYIPAFIISVWILYGEFFSKRNLMVLKERVAERRSNLKNSSAVSEELLKQISIHVKSYLLLEESTIQGVISGDAHAKSRFLFEISALQNRFPQLKSDSLLKSLMDQISNEHIKTNEEVKLYNQAVFEYNAEALKFIYLYNSELYNSKLPYWGEQ